MAEKEYIEREAVLALLKDDREVCADSNAELKYIRADIRAIPAADVVSRGAYDQTDWERCVALTQLKEIGKSFGERMDNVRPVVLCGECKFWERERISCEGLARCNTGESGVRYRNRNDFCSRGIKMEES